MGILIHWVISALAIAITAKLLPGVQVDDLVSLFITAFVLGIINAVIKPIAIILTLPITIITLGLFTLVINALMIMLTSYLVPGFHVANFWWALIFSILLSIVSTILQRLVK